MAGSRRVAAASYADRVIRHHMHFVYVVCARFGWLSGCQAQTFRKTSRIMTIEARVAV